MSAELICLPADVDVSQLTFSPPKSLDTGGKMIYVYHKGKPLILQTPSMVAPYGVNKWTGDRNDKYKLDLSLNLNDPNTVAFKKLLEDIDNKLIDDGVANSLNWFKKKQAKEVVEALYSPLVKYSKNKETGDIETKYPPVFSMNIPCNNGKFGCEIYNSKREAVDVASVIDTLKQSNVQAIVQCSGIWIAGGKYGCSFKVLQMKYSSNRSVIKGYAFIDDEDDVEM